MERYGTEKVSTNQALNRLHSGVWKQCAKCGEDKCRFRWFIDKTGRRMFYDRMFNIYRSSGTMGAPKALFVEVFDEKGI